MAGPGTFLIDNVERHEVEEVLESGYLSRYGREDDSRFKKKVLTLEREFARKIGVNYCVAVSGGTGALMASLVALGVGPGVEVLVSGYTFVASISAIVAVGGMPVLTEIDESITMDPVDIERKITKRTKVIMPVHMLGYPCNMDKIMKIANKYKLFVLEDSCQALGASYKGEKLGSIGDMGTFSLNVNKTISSGDGGLITTNKKELFEKAFGFHDQGHMPLRMGVEIGKRKLIGINLRMNELTGAFALGQLKKLDLILKLLKEKKEKFKNVIIEGGIKNITFNKINDPGECNTILTILFKDKIIAQHVAKALKTKTLSESGWHVYNNMEQILSYIDQKGNKPFKKNMLPKTDEILTRSINLSIGVVDPGIGTDFGINILSSNEEIYKKAEEFIKIVKPIVN